MVSGVRVTKTDMQPGGIGLGAGEKKVKPQEHEIAEVSFRKCQAIFCPFNLLHETHTTGHLSSSVAPWSKELDFNLNQNWK